MEFQGCIMCDPLYSPCLTKQAPQHEVSQLYDNLPKFVDDLKVRNTNNQLPCPTSIPSSRILILKSLPMHIDPLLRRQVRNDLCCCLSTRLDY